jgi:hypothetical protein
MIITEQLLKIHSKSNTEKIASHIGNDGKKFSELMKIVFSNKEILTQRAAWVMRICAEKNSRLILPFQNQLIFNLTQNNIHDAVKRNTLGILIKIKTSENVKGNLVTNCFALVSSKKEAIAVKSFAFQILSKIAKSEPDLKKELTIVLDQLSVDKSPAIEACIKKIRKQLLI